MNYYNILQIDENASPEEIKQAYHKMARLFHPDNFNGSREDAEEQMRKINEAYKVLSDPEMKNKYDEKMWAKEETDPPGQKESGEEHTPEPDRDDSCVPEPVVENEISGCFSSCLSKIIEWIICLGVFCFILNHFNVLEKVRDFVDTSPVSDVLEKLDTDSDVGEMSPETVVKTYLKDIKAGKTKSANELFSEDADKMFHKGTVKEFNKLINHIYYGAEKDAPLYPLFEEIRKFSYKIISSAKEGDKAKVLVHIENCDIALVEGLLMQADPDEIASMSDYKLRRVVRKALEKYKEDCLIDVDAIFVLVREDGWKIKKIKPLKRFGKVIVGQADELILALNGETVDDTD